MRLRRKRVRHELKQFLAEGEDLLEAAIRSGIRPRRVFLREDTEAVRERFAAALSAAAVDTGDIDLRLCSKAVIERISLLGGGSRVVAVFDFLHRPGLPAGNEIGSLPLVYLAGIGDPGNLGTIIRSAAALGAAGVVLDPETADPYGPKALRASMGSLFSVPLFLSVNTAAIISLSRRLERPIVCTDAHDGIAAWEAGLTGAPIFVFGSERGGIPRELMDAAAAIVRIPLMRQVESINAAMAATAILYESLRQRLSD